jgi:hypothetical protein
MNDIYRARLAFCGIAGDRAGGGHPLAGTRHLAAGQDDRVMDLPWTQEDSEWITMNGGCWI